MVTKEQVVNYKNHISKEVHQMRLIRDNAHATNAPNRKMIADRFLTFRFAANTAINTIDKMLENTRENIKHTNIDLSKYMNKWRGKTCISLAFGPSLNKNIDEVIKRKDKYKIIMVDRGVDWIMKKGIRPDFVVSLDAAIGDRHLGNHDLTGITLLANIGCNYKYVNRWVELGGDVSFFLVKCSYHSHYLMHKESGIKHMFDGLGNVGNGVVEIALDLLQAKKVLLVGYDHSFSDIYYPDNDNMPHKNIGKKLKKKLLNKFKSINGEDVYTDLQMYKYNENLFNMLQARSLFDRVINCTEGGILALPQCKKLSEF